MKKTISIILLILFLFNSAGYFLVFKINQNKIRSQIKTEIKLGLSKQELTTITFKNSEISSINWTKENKEFIYNNNMYDIVKSEKTENGISYLCINDKQEKELFANLDEHIQKHTNTSNHKNKTNKNSLDSFFKIYFFDNKKISHFINESTVSYFEKALIYNTHFTSIDSPPPQYL